MKLHQMIDRFNSNLRSIEKFDGKTRKREFYNMSATDTYSILETTAQINGLEENLRFVKPSEKEVNDEKIAEENRYLANNRHHFKNIEFNSSLTGHTYRSLANDKDTLSILILLSWEEIPNNANPSK